MPRCEMCGEWPDCPWKTDPEIMCGEYHPKPITNADRLRSMSDEELADWFYRIQYDVSDYYCGGHSCEPTLPARKESWLVWLKQEAKE